MSEVCRSFRNTGSCRYGEDCKFEHSEGEPVQAPERQDRGECFNFRDNGECDHGDLCRFSHGPDDARPRGGPEVCRNYLQGRCANGDACHRLHEGTPEVYVPTPRRARTKGKGACFAWRDDGACERGDDCLFSHGETGAEDAGGDYEEEPRKRRTRAAPKGPGECFSFRDEGKCEYGDECRFAHGGVAPTPRPRGECFDFRDGNCDRGDGCRFSHDGEAGEAGDGAPRERRERTIVKLDEECNNFKAGTCRQGDRCRRIHVQVEA